MTTKDTNNISNVFDKTAELYGNLSYLFTVLDDNSFLSGVTDSVEVGESLTYDDSLVFLTPVTVQSASTTTVSTLIAIENQDAFDLSLQLFGDVAGVFSLLEANPTILSVNDRMLAGKSLQYVKQNFNLPTYFRKNRISITNGFSEELIRSFDLSFDISFR